MATLVLVRHSQAAVGREDVDRPLTSDGVQDATAVGGRLAGLGLIPDAVVVSPARRAQETWDHACAGLRAAGFSPPPPLTEARVYVNTAQALFETLLDVAPEHRTVVLVGHNPSIERLARMLADGGAEPAAAAEMVDGFPTSGVAVFAVDGPISAVSPANATLTAFFAVRG